MELPSPDSPQAPPKEALRAGSILYTRAGLFTVFTWLLWGDFSFTLMESVWPSVLPLKLHSLNASNTTIALLITTIPSLMNFVLNPVISTMSDRHRSRLGRRIPFLLFATPFVCILLVLLGFSRQLGTALHQFLGSPSSPWLNTSSLTIGLIAVLIVSFRFFELFVNTVYWYLFNDVVPSAYFGRFMGLFRTVGTLAGALYNFFVYRYAESHASEIFLGAAILYGVAFFSMCLNVREGTYPPPDSLAGGSRSPWSFIKNYGRECFSHRIFIFVYLSAATWALVNCLNTFNIFMATSLGLNLDQVGKIIGGSAIAGACLMIPAGMLVDRFHPIRVMLVAKIGLCVIAPLNLIYLFFEFPPTVVFWLYLAKAVVSTPLSVVFTAASVPMLMRVLPHERYGQFCSASAMCSAAATIIGGVAGGILLDILKNQFHGVSYYYRFLPVWVSVFSFCTLAATWLLYREWKKLGGTANYRPPISDKFAGSY